MEIKESWIKQAKVDSQTYETKYKYIFCPQGKGLDDSRTYESIILGNVPIRIEDELSKFNADLPIIYELWMQIKTVAILLLTHYHFYLGKHLRLFSSDENSKSSKFFRIINEIPTILLIVIVIVVVFKPL